MKDQIAFPKHDNWKAYEYDKRILDALANLFHFKSPCAALVKQANILYLSYNTQIASKDTPEVTSQINLLLRCINTSVEETITAYLLLNSTYLEFYKKSG